MRQGGRLCPLLMFTSRLTVGVCVDLCKGPQGEADAVLRAGEANVAQERRHHQVLVCGVGAERQKQLFTLLPCALLHVLETHSFQHV